MRLMKGLGMLAAIAVAMPVSAQEVHRIPAGDVAIYNLAGTVEVTRGSGSDVVVRINRGGDDADELEIATGVIQGRETLRVIYHADEVVYPEMGRGRTSQSVRSDGTHGDGGRRPRGERIDIRGSGSGLEAWADMTIEVPAGGEFEVYIAVGEITASGLDSDVVLDIASGQVTAEEITGALEVDTGSGNVDVQRIQGEISIDTGSGRIDAVNLTGPVVELDTGSGNIRARSVDADMVEADTGSGSIELFEILAQDVVVDTGSGSVEIELLTDVDVLEVDTGSGSVLVRAPEDLGGMVEIDTGSGSIDMDFPLEVRTVRRDHVQGRLGDGRGRIEIDTGSGSVRFVRGGSVR